MPLKRARFGKGLTTTKRDWGERSYVDAKLNSFVPMAIAVVASPWVRNCSVARLHINMYFSTMHTVIHHKNLIKTGEGGGLT